MSKTTLILAAGLLTAGFAMAQSSSLKVPKVPVKPASKAEALAIASGEQPQGLWCDSLGYQWSLSGSGMTGGVLSLTGSANICGSSPVAGTLTLAAGLPLDIIATVTPGCFCNQFHENVMRWDRAQGVFVGDAFAYGGCEGTAPITMGKC